MSVSARISQQRLNLIIDKDHEVLLYTIGVAPFWLVRKVCMFHDIAYPCVRSFRISDDNDSWCIAVNPEVTRLRFTDEALLPK